jgi:hypothetical protein
MRRKHLVLCLEKDIEKNKEIEQIQDGSNSVHLHREKEVTWL